MQPLDPDAQPTAPLFTDPAPARSFPTAAAAIAAVAIIILIAALVMLERRGPAAPSPHTLQPIAAYASNLEVSGLQMSESTSMSGGKQTYIEGHLTNHGNQTVRRTDVKRSGRHGCLPAIAVEYAVNKALHLSGAPVRPGAKL